MGPLRVAMNFIVSDQIDEVLIGIDWLQEHQCLLSFADLTITLQGYCFPLLKKVYSGTCNRVISEEEVILPAKSKAVIPNKVVYSNLHRPLPSLCVTDNKECRPGVKTARCLLNIGEGTNLPLRVMNINNEAVTLPAGTLLCPLREVEAVLEEDDAKYTEQDERARVTAAQIEKLVAGIHPDVPTEHVENMKKLLVDFSDILSRDEFDMGLTDLIQHDIDTGQERPVRQQLRKTPMVHNQIIETHIQSMLKQGLIEPSHSDWSSNIVLVLKKDKSYRFCLDYRQLNRVSRPDIFPLPRIDSSLDALGGVILVFHVGLEVGLLSSALEPSRCA